MSGPKMVQVGSIAAGAQPNAEELAGLRRQGIRSIVNVRLAHEAPHGLSPSQEGRVAAELGLEFVHLPVSADTLSEQDVHAFQHAVATLPAPVYAHCGLGQRAATLALLAGADRNAQSAQIIEQAENRGIDISSGVRNFIDRYLETRRTEEQEDEIAFARLVR